MTSWSELRAAVLIGTERRSPSVERLLDVDLGAGATPELRVLEAVALLSTARRAGRSAPDATQADTPTATPVATPDTVPGRAGQLLRLMIEGGAGFGVAPAALFEYWFDRATARATVLPHDQLVQVLQWATADASRRAMVAPVLGPRGEWLASQRDSWSWVADHAGDRVGARSSDIDGIADQTPEEQQARSAALFDIPADFDVDRLLARSKAWQQRIVRKVRYDDPARARNLVAGACERLDAASRADLLACLRHALGPDDEPLLEAALDDRSGKVRAVAIDLLQMLPDTNRSRRLAAWLAPLVSGPRAPDAGDADAAAGGLVVDYPPAPEGDQLRDLPPRQKGNRTAVEQAWLDTLVQGTPLSWWEATLALTPAEIVAHRRRPDTELAVAWARAAIAQGDSRWAQVLAPIVPLPGLVPLIGRESAEAAFLDSLTAAATPTGTEARSVALESLPQPWSPRFAVRILEWIRSTDLPVNGLNRFGPLLAASLPASTVDDLERWLAQVRNDKTHLDRAVRSLLQQLSLRSAIDDAFSDTPEGPT